MVIKIVRIDEHTAIDESGCRYAINDDARGVNEKLWIKKVDGEFLDSYLIKFSTRKPNTLNELNLYNEVICSKICEQLGLYHVDYELCDFVDLDGSIRHGVISQNYRKTPNRVEVNGKSIHNQFCEWCYDNNFGKIPDIEVNTVYTYIEQLKTRFVTRKMIMSEATENRLTNELLTLALFDFCTCQIDRHWGNVGWLHNNIFEDEDFKIQLLPIYDNECTFLLDDMTEENLLKLVENINTPKKTQIAIDMVNRKKYHSPYLGIKTALVRIKDTERGFLVPLSYGDSNESNAAVAARELAHEINTRPEMKELYDRLQSFDIQKMLDNTDVIPESQSYIKDVYAFVWNTRVKLLNQAMEQSKNNLKGDQQNETSFSSL